MSNSAVADENLAWTRSPYGVGLGSDYQDYKSSLIDAAAKVLADMKDPSDGDNSSKMEGYRGEAEKAIDALETNSKKGDTNLTSHQIESQVVSDSSIFGNEAINPYSGFCRDDDIVPRTFSRNHHSYGMGRVYKEIYDSKQQVVYFQFGIPRYRNLFYFLKNASDANAGDMNDLGDTSILSTISNFFIDMAKMAIELPLLPFEWAHKFVSSLGEEKITEYFYFKEQMFIYWNYVNTILIHLASNIGLFDAAPGGDTAGGYNASLPKILQNADGQNRPDIFTILTARAARYNISTSNTVERVAADLNKRIKAEDDPDFQDEQKIASTEKKDENGKVTLDQNGNIQVDTEGKKTYNGWWDQTLNKIKGVLSKTWDGWQAHSFDNTKWLAFRLEKDSDNASESFSNSLSESSLQQELNAFVTTNRQNNLDASVAGGGILATFTRWGRKAQSLAQMATNIMGSKDVMTAVNSVIGYMHSGNGYYDLPQQWSGSSFTRSCTINIRLRSRTGGDPVSVFTNILIPFACILAGAAPRANGDETYTSPFIVRVMCRGMFSIPAGMITSLSINRGDSEFGWSIWRLPTTMSLSLQISDLSPILYIGLQGGKGILADLGEMLFKSFSNNSKYHEYFAILSGMGLKQRIYWGMSSWRKCKTMGRVIRSTYGNPTWWGMNAADSSISRAINAFRFASSMSVSSN